MESLNSLLNVADKYLSVLHTNPYLSGSISVFLVLYASLAAPRLPPFIASLFDHTVFKVLIFFLILAVRSYNPTVALLVAIGFLISMQTLSKYRIFSMAGELNLMNAVKDGVKSITDTLSNASDVHHRKRESGHGHAHAHTDRHDSDSSEPDVDSVYPPKPSQPHLKTSEPSGYPGKDHASYALPESEL